MAVRTSSTVPALGPDRAVLLNFLLDHLVWLILAVILIVFSLTIERFFQVGIFLNILQHATFVGLIAIGLSFCIIAGHMDLSVESVMAFSAMLAAWLAASRGSASGLELAPWLTLLIAIGFGALAGAFNGVLVIRFRINAFIVTLATFIAIRGLGLVAGGAHQWRHRQSRPRHAVRGLRRGRHRRRQPARRHRPAVRRVRRGAALEHDRHRNQRHGGRALLHAGNP